MVGEQILVWGAVLLSVLRNDSEACETEMDSDRLQAG